MAQRSLHTVFLSNLGLVILLNLLIKPLYIFGIDRTVQNVVGAEAYGLYFALFNFAFLFQMIHDLGIQNFNLVHFSKSPHLLTKYLPKVLGSKLVLAAVYFVVVLGIGLLLGYGEVLKQYLVPITVNHVLISLGILVRTSLAAMGHYRLDSVLSVLDKLLLILMIGSILILDRSSHPMTISKFIFLQTAAYVTTIAVGLVLLARNLPGIRLIPRIDVVFSQWLFKRTLPFALVLVLMTLYTRMDAVMIERLLQADGTYQAGIYAASYRLLDAANMAGVLVAGLLLPMFSKSITQIEILRDLVGVGFRVLWVIALIVVCTSLYFSSEIMDLLYVQATGEWASVFSVLMMSYAATAISYVYGTLLTASERLATMNRIFLVGVFLNFVLNLVLIPRSGALGSAIATVVTQGLVTAALIWLSQQRFRLLGSMRTGLLWLAFTGAGASWYFVVSLWHVDWKIQVCLGAIGTLFLALRMGYFPLAALLLNPPPSK